MVANASGPACPERLEDGVYHYVPGKGWLPGLPSLKDAPVILIFVNVLCRTSCEHVLALLQSSVGREIAEGRIRIGLVVCTRFRYVCYSDEARQLFGRFNIIASPSVIVLANGEVVASLKGRLRVDRELLAVLESLRGRAAAALESPGRPSI